jgi:hypothetical protein
VDPQSAAPVCLISSISGPAKGAWRAAFVECIHAAGLTPAEYSAGAVEGAACLLAFAPSGEGEVLFQTAYAMGRGVPVLVVVPVDEDVSRFDPKPIHVVEIELQAPDPITGARDSITRILAAIAQSQPAPRGLRPPTERQRGAAPGTVSTAGQAEALLASFVADGLSARLIHQLLLEAGCRESWVEFRLQQRFGGW